MIREKCTDYSRCACVACWLDPNVAKASDGLEEARSYFRNIRCADCSFGTSVTRNLRVEPGWESAQSEATLTTLEASGGWCRQGFWCSLHERNDVWEDNRWMGLPFQPQPRGYQLYQKAAKIDSMAAWWQSCFTAGRPWVGLHQCGRGLPMWHACCPSVCFGPKTICGFMVIDDSKLPIAVNSFLSVLALWQTGPYKHFQTTVFKLGVRYQCNHKKLRPVYIFDISNWDQKQPFLVWLQNKNSWHLYCSCTFHYLM